MELIFATHNQHKLEEVKKMFPAELKIKSLTDVGYHNEIEETESTFEGNAQLKARTVYNEIQNAVFADDSGLVIEALNGAPGIYSARYAGTANSADNIKKVLEELKGVKNRKAYFICIFCLILEGKEFLFEGRVNGRISESVQGIEGFGYDPIFIPEGRDVSFAEIVPEEKNNMSHRGKAAEKLSTFLSKR